MDTLGFSEDSHRKQSFRESLQTYEMENEYFDIVDGLENDYEWEDDDETVRLMKYIYDNLEEFKLLIMHSQGTKYEDFVHEVAKLEEEVTGRYMEELKAKEFYSRKKQGCHMEDQKGSGIKER
ncbi:MAG: hypothetical protein K6G22_02075 [Lachnospiraceae bacterium]|nr:hypothetical protein [Lachnospiraceae bacterium]